MINFSQVLIAIRVVQAVGQVVCGRRAGAR
jgi:hypothetical protein